MKRSPFALCLAMSALVFGACSTATTSPAVLVDAGGTIAASEPGGSGPTDYTQVEFYEARDGGLVVVLSGEEEDWCATFEGRAGGWLVANELGLVDTSTGEQVQIGSETVELLEVAASDAAAVVNPDDFAAIEPFLRYPVPSPLACRTAFGARDR